MSVGEYPPLTHRENQTGTFKESLRAPIHRWFAYPVGFSPRLVEEAIAEARLPAGALFYDPFAGTATSLIAARQSGLESHGLDAHPFIHFVGRTKLHWDVEPSLLGPALEPFIEEASTVAEKADPPDPSSVPALLAACYEPAQLGRLFALRDYVRATCPENSALRNLAELALAAIARPAASVSTKWPNVAPKRARSRAAPDAVTLFAERLRMMALDLATVAWQYDWPTAHLELADARLPHPYLLEESVDLVVTSAPYLNNFDYADRTRLETYLLGHYTSWRELTEGIRRHLVISATTQFSGLRVTADELLAPVTAADPCLGAEIGTLVERIAAARRATRGDKRFDLVVAGYFRDMLRVLTETRRLLRSNGRMQIVLGDSALYGVHVPTDVLVGRLGLVAGFHDLRVDHLRSRGNKWRAVRRSLHIPLRESLVTLTV